MVYTDEELLGFLTEFASTQGRTPAIREIKQSETIKRRFGSWNSALEKIGLVPNQISKDGFDVACAECGNVFHTKVSVQRKSKSGNVFCSKSCAASYNNKQRVLSVETKEKIRGTVKKNRYQPTHEEWKRSLATNIERIYKRMMTMPFDSLGETLQRKRILIEQDHKCNRCENDKWLGLPITFEIEHKDGNHSNNSRDNLEMLCPNCHSMTPTWRGRKGKQKGVTDQMIIDALEKHEGVIRPALIELGLVPTGSGYKRAKRLLEFMVMIDQ